MVEIKGGYNETPINFFSKYIRVADAHGLNADTLLTVMVLYLANSIENLYHRRVLFAKHRAIA